MAHLNSSYESFETFLNSFADAYFAVDLKALNNSRVSGTAILGVDLDNRTVNISISAENLTPNVGHAQHIHGLFDEDGTPLESNTPTLADDADKDGFIEVLEGVPSYGDVLLSLDHSDGLFPVTAADGSLTFIQSYSLDDDSEFVSPVTGMQYEGDDILPAQLRELVLHGVVVPNGQGAGTGNEVDGGKNGFLPLLPAAAGEFEEISLAQALDILEDQQAEAGNQIVGTAGGDKQRGSVGDDVIIGRGGDDTMIGLGGDDSMEGRAGNDMINGRGGDDALHGFRGDDTIDGSNGNDSIRGSAGNDSLNGGRGLDLIFGGDNNDLLFGDGGRDRIFGQQGDDLVVGGDGSDHLFGGAGNDIIGGLAGRDLVGGGEGSDEFHFDAGTGTDRIRDFKLGEDVISFLDGGAIEFANSSEDNVRGNSDLSASDYAERLDIRDLKASDDQKVVVLKAAIAFGDLRNDTSESAVESYIVAFNETRGEAVVLYDDDWSTTDDRETIARLTNIEDLATVQSLSVSDFDVY